ncbi:MAG: NPCBM/NEW2 domain-containing protein [Oscillospiraceae bacterium]|nr:NPCBM/NEW2 domain-containing protein [Oscillospiraceae bacterium]
MAKFCEKCGQPLAEDENVCPACGAEAAPAESAAAFTTISAETEDWREKREPTIDKKKLERTFKMNRRTIIMCAVMVLLAALIVGINLYNQPISQIGRALGRGEYSTALELWSENLSEKETSKRLAKYLSAAADDVYTAYTARELTHDEATEALDALVTMGLDKDKLAAVTELMDEMYASQSAMDNGRECYANGNYLEAADSYLLVIEADPDYADSRTLAEESLQQYGLTVVTSAQTLMELENFVQAIEALHAADSVLLEYDTFCPELDDLLAECGGYYEQFVLSEAEEMAAQDDYAGAVEAIELCAENLGELSETLSGFLDSYKMLYDNQVIAAARVELAEPYAAGDYAAAFEIMETAAESVYSEETAAAAVLALEQQFTADVTASALAAFDGDLDNVETALQIVTDAVAVRSTAGLESYKEYYESLMPVSVLSLAYTSREGTVFRSTDGWLWGGNEDSIVFSIDGEYNYFEGVFGVNSTDYDDAEGWFEIYRDDELVYTSDTLYADSNPTAFRVDITDFDELKVVFHCNYEVSTIDGGYCYHCISDAKVGLYVYDYEPPEE